MAGSLPCGEVAVRSVIYFTFYKACIVNHTHGCASTARRRIEARKDLIVSVSLALYSIGHILVLELVQ